MIYPDVQDLTNQDLKVLCDAYRKNNFIDPEISEKLGVKRGLRNADGTGVLAGLTNICDVIGYQRDENNNIIPIDGKLIYRGIDLNDIVNEAITQDRFLFEEVAWLLLFGSLPNKETLDNFRRILETHRELPDGFAETQIMAAPSPNLMNKMARSVLAMYSYDEEAENTSLENVIKQSINLIAEMPSMMVYAYQTKKHAYDHESLYFHYPKPGLSTAENILAMRRSKIVRFMYDCSCRSRWRQQLCIYNPCIIFYWYRYIFCYCICNPFFKRTKTRWSKSDGHEAA